MAARTRVEDESRDWGEGELDLALAVQDCPVCFLARETEEAVLTWLAIANIRDDRNVDALVRRRGLCSVHWTELWRRSKGRVAVAVARAAGEIARACVEDLAGAEPVHGPRCPVCASMARRVSGAIELVLGRVERAHARSRFAASFGLCQPHLGDALHRCSHRETATALVAIQRSQVKRLLDDVRPESVDDVGRRAAERLSAKLAGTLRLGAGAPDRRDEGSRRG